MTYTQDTIYQDSVYQKIQLDFLDISLEHLTHLIATNYPDWQVFYLYNNHKPIIGILPSISFLLEYNKFKDKEFKDNQPVFVMTQYTFDVKKLSLQTQTKQPITLDNYKKIINDYYYQKYTNRKKTNKSIKDGYFFNGLMGFIGYDIGAYQLNHTIGIDENMPCAFFGNYDCYINQQNNQLFLYINKNNKQQTDSQKNHSQKLNFIIHSLKNLINTQTLNTQTSKNPIVFTKTWGKDDYNNAFYQTQDYLKQGDIYQINLTQKFTGKSDIALHNYLQILTHHTKAPFLGYVFIKNCEILSVSPELFFEFKQSKEGEQQITTKPIKGTRPRHKNILIDNQLKNELKHSEKDLAENVMIVDLLRNDLGKYAKTGQVFVPQRFEIESFSNVHHMVSTVCATLQDDVSPITVLFESLPAGSITGSPKKRACEIISELEICPRGAYCGTMGLIDFDGNGAFNVLIRTLQSAIINNERTISLWAGGGITVLSNSADEYQECFDKIQHIMQILQT